VRMIAQMTNSRSNNNATSEDNSIMSFREHKERIIFTNDLAEEVITSKNATSGANLTANSC
jgi:hypothetical protein